MRFELPDATSAMNEKVAAAGADGEAWDVIGAPLDHAVGEVAPEYGRKLELDLAPAPEDKRLEVAGLHWGRIGKDAARLHGLAAAIENVAGVVRAGRERLAHDWKGEAYDAFRTSIEKVERTLDDYAGAVRGAAGNLEAALSAIRTEYATYRDDAVNTHLKFTGLTEPGSWRKVDDADVEHFADRCDETLHGFASGCLKNNDEQKSYIVGRIITQQNYDDVAGWLCQDNAGLVIGQYQQITRWADEERSAISGKINNWYEATDQLRSDVDKLLADALDTLRIIAETKPFQTLSIVDAGPPAGGAPATPSQAPIPSAPPPAPESAPEPVPSPASEAPEPKPESVEIKHADRTIAVNNPTDEGQIKITVDTPAGETRSYTLDFDAASGLTPAAEPLPDTEHVPAGTNGKCVIRDGQVTIIAERSLFDADTITVTVGDGTSKPTTYTVDFTAEPEPPASADSAPDSRATGSAPVSEEPVEVPGSAESAVPDAESSVRGPVESAVPDAESSVPGAVEPAVPDAESSVPGAVESAVPDAVDPVPGAPRSADPDSPDSTPDARNSTDPDPDPARSAPTEPANPAETSPTDVSDPPAPDSPPVNTTAPANSSTAEATATQSDPSGRLSGVLLSDPPEPGEAGLASAADGEPAGATGSAVPVMAAAGAAGSGVNGDTETVGRAGTGWSVHGDLFDSGDPVHSMHGVLGEDDLKSQ
ncbi:hypothetical protein [Actinophytocola gossypii]|uniref:WXG100 family type VII secretion target n=1 Tax=Actinophytocola gossypii TaxID=2812003 RepID=A0ABT2JHP2_9PSEU|nr:hypothetical protein [Actinophytocola gossypii]MCT2587398.1 hypothetical protein [Actinophytocola gossypii]